MEWPSLSTVGLKTVSSKYAENGNDNKQAAVEDKSSEGNYNMHKIHSMLSRHNIKRLGPFYVVSLTSELKKDDRLIDEEHQGIKGLDQDQLVNLWCREFCNRNTL